MKNLAWLALLLPMITFADPATENGVNSVKASIDAQTPILEQIEVNTANVGGSDKLKIVRSGNAQIPVISIKLITSEYSSLRCTIKVSILNIQATSVIFARNNVATSSECAQIFGSVIEQLGFETIQFVIP